MSYPAAGLALRSVWEIWGRMSLCQRSKLAIQIWGLLAWRRWVKPQV